MDSSSLILLCIWVFAAFSGASSGEARPFGLGVDKYVCTYLGGAVINVEQVNDTGTVAKLPAVRTVFAEWNVPWLKVPSGLNLSDPNNRHSLAQWVGILGGNCDEPGWFPFLQAGTAIDMDEKGVTEANAWVEWFPAGAHTIPNENMTINPGDQILTTIDVYTRTTGHVHMKNIRTGQEYETNVTADSPDDPQYQICLGKGTGQFFQEWTIANDRADVPVFNNVTFVGVGAIDRHGKAFDFSTGTGDYWNMTDSGRQVAIPEGTGQKSFVVYSPEGRMWIPPDEDHPPKTT
ncbi:concanavalin A-like lectin/glucanase [Hypoxylon trugodes]|uniref:concanavalin A-like lectin/glucanase n=1 Tax=Hypoxylon trugodes TaxID=326681 RepID=UPI00218DCAA2|nr:concanavalin A-like lectin/glucanase [Hypoxylon trugodes]KAI1392264.1 concanavalin A-like lectin/glucanase [Hypoxylon trugodes]